jgi:hypothetical protein
MLHRVRLAMRTGTFQKMTGTTEADETVNAVLNQWRGVERGRVAAR